LVGAFATVATGIAFPATEQLAFILLIAFVGTMNPSSGDIGLLVPLEHAMLAREAPDHDRTRIFDTFMAVDRAQSVIVQWSRADLTGAALRLRPLG